MRKARSSRGEKASLSSICISEGQDVPIPHQILPTPATFIPVAQPPSKASVVTPCEDEGLVDHLSKNSYEIVLLIDAHETFK